MERRRLMPGESNFVAIDQSLRTPPKNGIFANLAMWPGNNVLAALRVPYDIPLFLWVMWSEPKRGFWWITGSHLESAKTVGLETGEKSWLGVKRIQKTLKETDLFTAARIKECALVSHVLYQFAQKQLQLTCLNCLSLYGDYASMSQRRTKYKSRWYC